MKMGYVNRVQSVLVLFVISIVIAAVSAQIDNASYRICIPHERFSACEQMQKDSNPNSHKIKCVSANDKIDCIQKIVRNEADFVPLEPEEVYVAHRYQKDGFAVITEIRTLQFKNRDYRYEPVAVIRKSSGITSIPDLQGKKSCHTGFGRNAGWKIPFSHLMDKNQLPKLCEGIDAPTPEKDLYAISNYFGSACAPGSWVPEKVKDQQLKGKYSNLCALCESPSTCDWNDKFGGYEGALRCLTLKNADVAWTKMDAVEKFFKLNEATPLASVSEYSFLCWDGSSMPLTSKDPCSWAKRPWRAFVASSRLSAESIEDLQAQITQLRENAEEQEKKLNVIPFWLKDVLEFDRNDTTGEVSIEVHHTPHIAKLLTPVIYLTRNKNYTVTIEKPSCATKNFIKFCVRSEVEKSKCMALRLAAMGRRILPALHCVLGESTLDCIQKVAKGEADVVNLDPKDADWAKKNYGLEGILSELENIDGEAYPYRFALAVIKKDTVGSYKNISDLKGKRSCHGSIKNLAGWNIPLTVLRDNKEIGGPTCGLTIEMSKYFGNQSCVPGVPDVAVKMPWLPRKNLCALCAGDGPLPGKAFSPETICANEEAERYYGDVGALKCLQDGVADIAFTDHVGLHAIALAPGSKLNLTAEDLQLLCPNGKTMDVAHYQHCNWGKVPSRKILTRGGEEFLVQKEDARLTLLKIADTFGPSGNSKKKVPSVLKLFGPYFGNKDLVFTDTSVGLCDDSLAISDNNLISDFDYCTTSTATTFTSYLISSLIFVLLSSVFRYSLS